MTIAPLSLVPISRVHIMGRGFDGEDDAAHAAVRHFVAVASAAQADETSFCAPVPGWVVATLEIKGADIANDAPALIAFASKRRMSW